MSGTAGTASAAGAYRTRAAGRSLPDMHDEQMRHFTAKADIVALTILHYSAAVVLAVWLMFLFATGGTAPWSIFGVSALLGILSRIAREAVYRTGSPSGELDGPRAVKEGTKLNEPGGRAEAPQEQGKPAQGKAAQEYRAGELLDDAARTLRAWLRSPIARWR